MLKLYIKYICILIIIFSGIVNLQASAETELKIKPGTLVLFAIYGELGEKDYTVPPTGVINFPLIGKYKIVDKTQATVSEELRILYKKYIKEPQIIFNIKSMPAQQKEIYIVGLLGVSGIYKFADKISLKDLYLENQASFEAVNLENIKIYHSDGDIEILNAKPYIEEGFKDNFEFKDRDLIRFTKHKIIKVMFLGAAGVGNKEFPEGTRIFDAINPGKSAKKDKITIVRERNRKLEIIKVNYDRFVKKFDLSQNVLLEDKDIVFVGQKFFSEYNTFDDWLKLLGFLSNSKTYLDDVLDK